MASRNDPPTSPPAAAQRQRYLLFYKPYNVLSSFTDDEGRPTLADYLPVFGVEAAGRLDRDSEGLMLLTDDGVLAHRLTHPDHGLPKTYLAQVEGVPHQAALAELRTGVRVKGEMTAPAEVELLAQRAALAGAPRSGSRASDRADPLAAHRVAGRAQAPGASHDGDRRPSDSAPGAYCHRPIVTWNAPARRMARAVYRRIGDVTPPTVREDSTIRRASHQGGAAGLYIKFTQGRNRMSDLSALAQPRNCHRHGHGHHGSRCQRNPGAGWF